MKPMYKEVLKIPIQESLDQAERLSSAHWAYLTAGNNRSAQRCMRVAMAHANNVLYPIVNIVLNL